MTASVESRGTTTLVSSLFAIIVVLMVAALSGVIAVRIRPNHNLTIRLGSAPDANAASVPVCPPAAGMSGALLAQVLLTPPDGFVRQPDGAVNGGVLTVAQVVAGTQDPARAALELRNDGFEGAVLRVWINAGAAQQAQVRLSQFSCAAGAVEYFARRAAASYGVASPEPFVIDGLAQAQGERSTVADAKGHFLQTVGLFRNTIYAETSTFTPVPDDGRLVGEISDLQASALTPV